MVSTLAALDCVPTYLVFHAMKAGRGTRRRSSGGARMRKVANNFNFDNFFAVLTALNLGALTLTAARR